MLPDSLAFVDIETTGTSARFGRIIEIGILRVEQGKIVQTYNSLVNPYTYLPQEITQLTGITAKELETAPSFEEIAPVVKELLSDCVFVAHNVRFDYGFLKNEFARLEQNFSSKHFCTVRLSRMLFPQHRHHNLDSIIERYGFECKNRHRAFDDAKILHEFYEMLQKTVSREVLVDAINRSMKRTSIPSRLKQADIDSLPESPGVYLFYGSLPTAPLYIGKSINIKERVLSHFSADIRSGIEMKIAQQIESIETIKTAGELGALFLESQMIKKMLPIYNKMLRQKRELICLQKKENHDGYLTAEMSILEKIDVNKLTDFIGFFRSRRQVKDYLHLVKEEYQLCEKLLGLEKTSSACFGYRLDKCKGACQKEEMALKYNMRFLEAFSKNKILPWPFPGPISIVEENLVDGRADYFVIDKWCYLGTIKADKLGARNEEMLQEYNFDLDTYKILSRFMRNPTNMKKVKLVTKENNFLEQKDSFLFT